MAVRNNNCCRPNPPQEPAVPPLPVAETAAEPVMRRWPHPIAEADTQPEETLSAALCRIDCELARQTAEAGEALSGLFFVGPERTANL